MKPLVSVYPVRAEECHSVTNFPGRWTPISWRVTCTFDHLFLINDLEANGYGINELRADQIFTLSEGDSGQVGNRGLIAAGTGLGEGFLVWDGKTHTPMASEGGHGDFGPHNDLEIELAAHIFAPMPK